MTIIADVRENPNDCVQQMGRAHRDGQESPCEFPLLLGTVDEKVMGSFIRSCANMKTMKADSDPEYLDRIFLGSGEHQ
jgi:superfamily II DNA helicase RecQ